MSVLLTLLLACWGDDAYIVEGTVVEVRAEVGEVVLDHQPVQGLMPAMVMPFDVSDPSLLEGLEPGHQVLGRLHVEETGSELRKLRITGKGPAPAPVDEAPMPVWAGQTFPEREVALHDGTTISLGPAQTERVALTFLYTRCPLPEACPAIVARLQALQAALEGAEGARIVAVTIDPEHDTPEVLAGYADTVGAGERWHFGRVPDEVLPEVAMHAGMNVMGEGTEIVHSIRLLVLDRGGELIERYDDTRWPLDRVVTQLKTGAPRATPGASGTATPE